ncbi:MAG TPA: TVP38/TMEM64 family protein [Candidatus Obscuribacterales bacterium]
MSTSDTEVAPEAAPAGKKALWKPLLLIGAVILGLVLAKLLGLDQQLKGLEPWIKSLGPWGPVAFIGLYVGASIAALPGSVLTIAAGVLFGSLWGVIWVSLASTLAAACCFLIARYFARGAIEASLRDNPGFQKLDAMTAKNGVLIVALTRLVPLFPFNLLNYGFGLTKVPFGTYVLTSWLCMLPGTVLYVVGSDAVKKAVASGQIPWPLIAVVAAVLVLLTFIGKAARKKLKEAENS